MIIVRLEGKPNNLTIAQICAPTSVTDSAERESFYDEFGEKLQEIKI